MRKIIAFDLVTLDGFFAGPKGEIDWFRTDDEFSKYNDEQTKSFGTVIFGHTTYEGMASYWPTPDAFKNDPGVAGIMNSIPKTVFSETLKEVKEGPIWKNVKVFHEIRPEEIIKMKKQGSGHIGIFGSGTIMQQFAKLGLIDEYWLLVNPVILGDGKPLFKDIKNKLSLRLLATKVFKNGNVLLRYEPAKD